MKNVFLLLFPPLSPWRGGAPRVWPHRPLLQPGAVLLVQHETVEDGQDLLAVAVDAAQALAERNLEIFAECDEQYCRGLERRGWSSARALRPQYLLNLGAD